MRSTIIHSAIHPESSILSKAGRVALKAAQKEISAAELIQEVLVHLVDHGKIELGTPQSAKLRQALSLLTGSPD